MILCPAWTQMDARRLKIWVRERCDRPFWLAFLLHALVLAGLIIHF